MKYPCLIIAVATLIFGTDMHIAVLWLIAAGVWRNRDEKQPGERRGNKEEGGEGEDCD